VEILAITAELASSLKVKAADLRPLNSKVLAVATGSEELIHGGGSPE
jgi:hypothetical protein